MPSAAAAQPRQAQRGRWKGVTQQDAAKRASAECGKRVDTQRAAAERVPLYKERVAGLERDELGRGWGAVAEGCEDRQRRERGPTAASSHPCLGSHNSGAPRSGPRCAAQAKSGPRCGGVSGRISGAKGAAGEVHKMH